MPLSLADPLLASERDYLAFHVRANHRATPLAPAFRLWMGVRPRTSGRGVCWEARHDAEQGAGGLESLSESYGISLALDL